MMHTSAICELEGNKRELIRTINRSSGQHFEKC